MNGGEWTDQLEQRGTAIGALGTWLKKMRNALLQTEIQTWRREVLVRTRGAKARMVHLKTT